MPQVADVSNPAQWVENIICTFMRSPANSLKNVAHDKAWAEPLVGFSRGDDPLYPSYKEHVGPFHWTPAEAFALAFPQFRGGADQLTVISWILPQTEQTKADMRAATTMPTESCFRARIFGEEANVGLRKHVVETLGAAGIAAVAPLLLPTYGSQKSPQFGFASNWSERHAAYASGLGTFGLTDGLITRLGQAMRCGSVIAQMHIPPTPRPYSDHRAYCLYHARGTCGECIERCPVGAVTPEGHDKVVCRAYLDMTKSYVPTHFGFEGYGCGFCQMGVPCESRNPTSNGTE